MKIAIGTLPSLVALPEYIFPTARRSSEKLKSRVLSPAFVLGPSSSQDIRLRLGFVLASIIFSGNGTVIPGPLQDHICALARIAGHGQQSCKQGQQCAQKKPSQSFQSAGEPRMLFMLANASNVICSEFCIFCCWGSPAELHQQVQISRQLRQSKV